MKAIITTLILATSIFAANNTQKDIYAQKDNLGNYTQTISQKRDIIETYVDGKISKRVLVKVLTKPDGSVSTTRRLIKYDKSGKETYNSILSPLALFALDRVIDDNKGKF